MNLELLTKLGSCRWKIKRISPMNTDAVIFADEKILHALDDKTVSQMRDVASLPGVVGPVCIMPDAHSGYGFPIGGVGAFDPEKGVISAGGVGFDISCGVRTLTTGLKKHHLKEVSEKLADSLFKNIPSGTGVGGKLKLTNNQMDEMLSGGASWAVGQKMGFPDDLRRIENNGVFRQADPSKVSKKAKQRMIDQLGTLGSGNHYLEVQYVEKIFDEQTAKAFGIAENEILVSIHCGSRGLGHQIATDYLPLMVKSAAKYGIKLPNKDIACAPIKSSLGQDYLKAMGAGINCALANRQRITHLVRNCFADILPKADLKLLYDVSHNTCNREEFLINGHMKTLYVHRKGATRALGPNSPELPHEFKKYGQPVIIGGSMGTSSYILAGTTASAELSFSSSCHGAGRVMSRTKALKSFKGKNIQDRLNLNGIIIKSGSIRGLAEEAPKAYKDVERVINVAEQAGISKIIARLKPIICVKG
ncbi:tRNA-splicing ligase RtcB [Maridesulfovibrio ferrireducens]|uniref:tRNA-splicing ligase RtcB n=1 Tax=Maridesulfovibrio ferrireducens TaxID=246191 RepID=A0A1G9LJS6_9BACT|nr:RtcB family protein [Maridesulfovibrio ferrireducens]SDL62219.1 tRNA-splicing ligase RtcB [Maridesulfovibrio ferrireducens]